MCSIATLPRSAIVADETNPASPTEKAIADLPNALRSAQAPIVFFDDVETFGHYNGIVHFTLKVALPESQQSFPQVTAAYLRMNILAFRQLQSAVEKVDLMLKRDGAG
jgi:hypothetical protein